MNWFVTGLSVVKFSRDMTFRDTQKFLLALFIPLLLVFGQQAAIRHEIGHFKSHAEQQDKQLPAHDVCDECGAYSQIAGGVFTTLHALAIVPATLCVSTETKTVAVAADIPASRNRGPPVFL